MGERAFVVELEAATISSHGHDSFGAAKFTVIEELDQVRDLGFTTGLINCLTKDDVEALRKKKKKKKHNGRIPDLLTSRTAHQRDGCEHRMILRS